MTSAENLRLELDKTTPSPVRVARWSDVMGVSGRVHIPDAEHFTGTLKSRSIGELRTMHVNAATFRLERDRAMARGMRRDYVFLNLVEAGRISGAFSLKKVQLAAGDVMISRMSSTMDILIEEAIWLSLIVPRRLLDRYLKWSPSLDARVYGSLTAEAVMIGGLLRSLMVLPPDLPPRQATCAIRTSLAMLSACLGGKVSDTAGDLEETDLSPMIRRFIAERIADPQLGPELICREFGMSRSRFYRVMGEGADIAAAVRRMRLHGVHRDIVADGASLSTLAEISGKWGLIDQRSLRRAFVQEFGYAPSILRKRVREGASSSIKDVGTLGADLQRWFSDL